MQKIFGRAVQPLLPQKVLSVAIVTVAFCICAAASPVAASTEEGDKQPAEVFTHKVEKSCCRCRNVKTPGFLARSKILLPGFMPEMPIKMRRFAAAAIL